LAGIGHNKCYVPTAGPLVFCPLDSWPFGAAPADTFRVDRATKVNAPSEEIYFPRLTSHQTRPSPRSGPT